MTTTLRWLPPFELADWREHIAATYRTAFAPPPYLRTEPDVQQFLSSLQGQPKEPGFQFLGAFTGNPAQLVGFAYTRRVRPGQWWYEAVAPDLRQAGLGFWLDDSYQLVELAVHLGYQRRGIGAALHDELLAALAGERLLLSTSAAETPAAHLYASRGWQILIPAFTFPGISRPYRILGREPEPAPPR
jgi:ribosomal protein S18 acetylase RimI-like enzyme